MTSPLYACSWRKRNYPPYHPVASTAPTSFIMKAENIRLAHTIAADEAQGPLDPLPTDSPPSLFVRFLDVGQFEPRLRPPRTTPSLLINLNALFHNLAVRICQQHVTLLSLFDDFDADGFRRELAGVLRWRRERPRSRAEIARMRPLGRCRMLRKNGRAPAAGQPRRGGH